MNSNHSNSSPQPVAEANIVAKGDVGFECPSLSRNNIHDVEAVMRPSDEDGCIIDPPVFSNKDSESVAETVLDVQSQAPKQSHVNNWLEKRPKDPTYIGPIQRETQEKEFFFPKKDLFLRKGNKKIKLHSTVSKQIGEKIPRKRGQKYTRKKRIFGTVTKIYPKEGKMDVKFRNGLGLFKLKPTEVKFHGNDDVTHIFGKKESTNTYELKSLTQNGNNDTAAVAAASSTTTTICVTPQSSEKKKNDAETAYITYLTEKMTDEVQSFKARTDVVEGNDTKTHRQFYSDLFKKYNSIIPSWMKRDSLVKRIRRELTKRENSKRTDVMVLNTRKVGRPKGCTLKKVLFQRKCIVSARNEVMHMYVHGLQNGAVRNGLSKEKYFKQVLSEVKTKNKLPEDFDFCYQTARSRVRSGNHYVYWDALNGKGSPLKYIENDVVNLMVVLSKCRHPLDAASGLKLVNALIAGTKHQEMLIDFKRKLNIPGITDAELGRVGQNYWRGFLQRNREKI